MLHYCRISHFLEGKAIRKGRKGVTYKPIKLVLWPYNLNNLILISVSYVMSFQFNEDAKKAACFDNLVQANVRNKKILKDAVQNITAKGITNYKDGFDMAFQQLLSVNVSIFLKLPNLKCYQWCLIDVHFWDALWLHLLWIVVNVLMCKKYAINPTHKWCTNDFICWTE